MKKFLFLCLLLTSLTGFSQQWNWSVLQSSYEFQRQHSMAADSTGNLFIVTEQSSVTSIGNHQLDSGYTVIKYNTGGAIEWVRTVPITVTKILTRNNDILILGNFTGTIQLANANILQGNQDFVILKMSQNGALISHYQFGGNNSEQAYDMTFDRNENLYIAGSFKPTANFGQFVLHSSNAESKGFVLKLDETLNPVLAFQSDFHTSSLVTKVKVSQFGNIFITGLWGDSCQYCSGQYIRKFSDNGVILNTKGYGVFEYFFGFDIDSKENIYVVYNDGSHYTTDPMIQHLSTDFTVKWEFCHGNGYNGYTFSYGYQVDVNDHLRCVGNIGGNYTPNVDTFQFRNIQVSKVGKIDAIALEIDSFGNHLSVLQLPGHSNTWGGNMLVDTRGNLYISGMIDKNDSLLLTDTLIANTNLYHNFLARYGNMLLSIRPTISEQELLIYPNPFQDRLYIDMPVNSKIDVYSIEGKQQKIQFINKREIDVSNLNAGNYIVKVGCEDGNIYRQIVVKAVSR